MKLIDWDSYVGWSYFTPSRTSHVR